ncbi:MAG: beta-lactamase family protein [Comamonadaceae bacterium]|nr:beta-lactamase family protein [Comamonadaceae bacterium]
MPRRAPTFCAWRSSASPGGPRRPRRHAPPRPGLRSGRPRKRPALVTGHRVQPRLDHQAIHGCGHPRPRRRKEARESTDPVTRYFDGVPADKASITLHQLLTHSSGLADPGDIGDYDPVPLPEYVRRVFAEPLLFAPGTGYEYSNANFSLLGAIIEKLTGLSYEAFLRERILPAHRHGRDRLSPAAVGRRPDGPRLRRRKALGDGDRALMAADGPHRALRANGGIQSTVFDMLRWARALLAGRVLAPESMKKLWAPTSAKAATPSTATAGRSPRPPTVRRSSPTTAGTASSSQTSRSSRTRARRFPHDQRLGRNAHREHLAREDRHALPRGQAPLLSIPEIVDLDAPALAALAGTYNLPASGGAYRLTTGAGGTSLFIEAEGQKAFATRSTPPGRLSRGDSRRSVA